MGGSPPTFKDALTRQDAVKSGIPVLGLCVAALWSARVIAVALFVILSTMIVINKT